MNDLDAKAWVHAAQTYQHLRRLMLLLNLGCVGGFWGFAFCMCYASAKNWDAFGGALFLVFIPVSLIFGLVLFIVSIDLRGFRCPRCGDRFTVSRWNNWPTNRCKHCRLDLMALAKNPGRMSEFDEL